MQMQLNRFLRYVGWTILLWVLVESCEVATPAVTPTATITFTVNTQTGDPIPNARVYLFSTQSAYEAYLQDNPDADPAITPSLTPDKIGNTNAQGQTTFSDYDLDGPFYSSGTTHFYNPNPIYVRIEGSINGADYLTNDNDITRLSFGELESGDMILEETEVIVD